MANTLAQNPTAQTFSNATTAALAFAGAGTNPSLYVATITTDGALPSTATIADDKNAGNYTADASTAGATTAGWAGVFSKQNTSTGTATVTGTISSAAYGQLKTFELTSAATSAALDTSNTGEGILTARSVAITTGTANCTVISSVSAYPNDLAVDTNFTQSYAPTGNFNAYGYGEYRVDAGALGTITLTYAAPGNSNYWTMAVAAYKTAGGAAQALGSYYYRQVAGRG